MNQHSKFAQTFSALITPFKNGNVDYLSLEKLLKHQIENGVRGFVVNGTTAESPTLEPSEVKEIFNFIKIKSKILTSDEVILILGTGSNSTKATVEFSAKAKDFGADAVLVVVPYYNKPPQRGLYEHFVTVARASTAPVILYNVPGRTITSLTVETVAQLSQVENIIGIKEATGDIQLLKEMKSKSKKGFIFLSGDDASYVDFLKAGGDGVISVASQILPKTFMQWTEDSKKNQFSNAEREIVKFKKVIDLLFSEANPIPLKMALYKMGIIESAELRLPLVVMDEEKIKPLVDEMKQQGLL